VNPPPASYPPRGGRAYSQGVTEPTGTATIDVSWIGEGDGTTPPEPTTGEAQLGIDWLIDVVGLAPPEPAPDIILDQERLNSVREGMAEGRDMGIWAEIVRIVDAIIELRDTDQLIIHEAQIALQNIVNAATTAIAGLRAQAAAGFDAVNARMDSVTAGGTKAIQDLAASTTAAIGSVRTDATAAIAQLRTDATAGINAEANTRGQADVTLQGNITGLSTATTNAITADRARLTRLEQRLTAAGIP
jgi:hypothetical protein